MSNRSIFAKVLHSTLACMIALMSTISVQANENAAAQIFTYDKATGETFYALAIRPNGAIPAPADSDVIVMFDTSASQTGIYRKDALGCLDAFLSNMDARHRVKLVAVDLDAVSMSEGFVTAGSDAMKGAVAKLNERAPLGSTDMATSLQSVVADMKASDRKARHVVYIGDGISRANILQMEEFNAILDTLVEERISISSFAIGPQRDVQLLGVLANKTGGIIRVDRDDQATSRVSGAELADGISMPVLWTVDAKLPEGMTSVFKQQVPPLRPDRETVVIGTMNARDAQQISISAEVQGEVVEMQWDVKPADSNQDYSFLPHLVSIADNNGGAVLPTVGIAGLEETRLAIQQEANQLIKAGTVALQQGDVTGAKKVAGKVLEQDPGNPEAEAILSAAGNRPDVSTAVAASQIQNQTVALQDPTDEAPLVIQGQPADDLEDSDGFLNRIQNERSVVEGKLRQEVKIGLEQARSQIGVDPEGVVQRLKQLIAHVDTSDVSTDSRQELRQQIEDTIREANARQADVEYQQREQEEIEANAQRLKNLADEFDQRQEKIKGLFEKFNVLMEEARLEDDRKRVDEGMKYVTADDEIAMPAKVLLPFDGTPVSASWHSRFQRHIRGLAKFRDLRHKNFADVMYEVEEALIPFPAGDSPLKYPEAEFWHRISVERKKRYGNVATQGMSKTEQEISEKLNGRDDFVFFDTPLQEVLNQISNKNGIPIYIVEDAMLEAGVDSATPVSIDLKQMTIKTGLRLLLENLGLTYVIKDDVLKITTKELAENEMITLIYPVSDLVMPIMGGGGALGGGMGMGGGGMGGGGMGGGMGGMGGGGMGGFQNVDDELTLGTKKADESDQGQDAQPEAEPVKEAAPAAKSETNLSKNLPRVINMPENAGTTRSQQWTKYFESRATMENEELARSDRDVRYTITIRMKQAEALYASEKNAEAKQRLSEVQTVLMSAIQTGQSSHWMYQALGLAMQANNAPLSEVERALMSALDYTSDPDHIIYLGAYLSELGLYDRSLKVLQEVSAMNPYRAEPYIRGLAVAKRTQNLDALQWATAGILRQAWPKKHAALELEARRTAEAVMIQLERDGRVDDLKRFTEKLAEASHRDCKVVVTWTGDADIDLQIQEPSGTVCSHINTRTVSGGVMLGDTYAVAGRQPVKGYSETYLCPEAFNGEYRMLVRRITGKVNTGKVTVDIFTDNPERPHIHEQIPLNAKDALVVFDVVNGRRVEPIGAQQLDNLRKHQEAVGQALLAQQFQMLPATSTMSSSSAMRDYAIARSLAARGHRFFLPNRAGVGYRPQITMLPQGTNFTAMGPVVSPDRRYIRITIPPIPISMGVGDVSTFNFATGESQQIGGDREGDDQNGQGGGGGNN